MEETSDVYRTVDEPSAGEYYEKRSKFLAFLEPVHSLDEVKERVDFYQKKGLLRVIDGDQDMDTIFASIMAIVKG